MFEEREQFSSVSVLEEEQYSLVDCKVDGTMLNNSLLMFCQNISDDNLLGSNLGE